MNQEIIKTLSCFTEPLDVSGMSAWTGHIPFAMYLAELLRPRCFVELGTHAGDAYFAFCQSVAQSSVEAKCIAVDSWSGDKHAGFYDESVYERVKKINEQKYKKFSTLCRKTFDEAANDIPDGTIDLLHIDGLHTYEAVKHDFDTWKAKLSNRAVVLFHDTDVIRDDFGVLKFWNEIAKKYPSFEFFHSSGLGVLITGDADQQELEFLRRIAGSEELKQQLRTVFQRLGEALENRNMVQVVSAEFEETRSYVKHLERDISSVNSSARQLEDSISLREQEIEKLCSSLSRFQTDSIQMSNSLRAKDADISELKHILAARDTELTNLRDSVVFSVLSASVKLIEYFLHLSKDATLNCARAVWKTLPLPRGFRIKVSLIKNRALRSFGGGRESRGCAAAIADCAKNRQVLSICKTPESDVWPAITITAVTYNSSQWLDRFFNSLIAQSYPLSAIRLVMVDNSSIDQTFAQMKRFECQHKSTFRDIVLEQQSNKGFGNGHNAAFKHVDSDFFLVTNVDLEFCTESLTNVVRFAGSDESCVASWEIRQVPYEHPKYYDPVTLECTWSSHACVLIRSEAFSQVAGYESRIFMYGEDVELSYRFRAAGFVLKYVPNAFVKHYTYDSPNQVKSLQFAGSTLANAYIRLRYGSIGDILYIFKMYLQLLCARTGVRNSRAIVVKNFLKVWQNAPYFLLSRQTGSASFPLRGWDYELTRDGAFYEVVPVENNSSQLVTIVTRTYKGRSYFLKECLQSIANQTYGNIEVVIAEDGGDSMAELVKSFESIFANLEIRYLALRKEGRSAAGNKALAVASGEYLMFLDDDDLLFPDHVETLVTQLNSYKDIDGAYALSWQVETQYHRDADDEIVGYTEFGHVTENALRQEFDREMLAKRNYIPIQSIVFRRELYDKYGGFDEEMEHLEDWDLWFRYSYYSSFKLVHKTTSIFRVPRHVEERVKRQVHLDSAYRIATEKQIEFVAKQAHLIHSDHDFETIRPEYAS